MDADVTGPSIPKMYGLHEQAAGTEQGIYSCIAKDGTRIMSVNLLLEDEEDSPVIWRGNYCRCSKTILDRCDMG